jgi:hypothetical protein
MIRTWIAAGLIAALSLAALLPSALASTFVAWQVTDVAAGDLLNVRAWPNSKSRILVGYPSGTTLSMTGRCTGGVRLDEIQRLPAWKQRQIARYQWCEVWLDPHGTGEFRNGWVYGRYIRPA